MFAFTVLKLFFYLVKDPQRQVFSSPQCPDLLWNALKLLPSGYRGPFPEV
jgi:hypothetical protein